MKLVLFLLLVTFIHYSHSSVITGNNVDANIPEDVSAFKALHSKDDWVLFFHNGADSKQSGFFDSLFGIFGAKSDLDEEFQALVAQKYPIMEIDTQIEALKNVPQDYEVTTMPYIIAYHKNKEVWREMPSKDSATIIENIIKQEEKSTPVIAPAHPTPNEVKKQQTITQTVSQPVRQSVSQQVFTSVPPPLNPLGGGGEVRAEMTKTRLYLTPSPSLTLVDIFNIISYEFEEELYIDFSIY